MTAFHPVLPINGVVLNFGFRAGSGRSRPLIEPGKSTLLGHSAFAPGTALPAPERTLPRHHEPAQWTRDLRAAAERVVPFYNQRGMAEQWIKEGKGAIKWTRLSCRSFAANALRLQLHVLAYNLGNFIRMLAIPKGGGAVVTDQPAREADQDRCQGRQPWPLRSQKSCR
jgi:Transposase DDE domain group 1